MRLKRGNKIGEEYAVCETESFECVVSINASDRLLISGTGQ